MALLEGERFKMYQIFVMVLAVLLSAGAAGAQDFDAGVEAYERGDYAAALKEWHPLAEAGDADSQMSLGLVYDVLLQDDAEAVRWYRLAAEQGYPAAQTNLGVMYAKGDGVLQDNVQAHMRGNIGCALGHENGCKLRERVAEKMTPADISEAQRRARVCMESDYKDCD